MRVRVPIETVMDKVSPQMRIVAVVLVLVGAAGMLALRTMGPSTPVAEAAPVVTQAAPKPVKAAAAKPKPTTAAKQAKPKSEPAEAAAQAPALNAPRPVVPATGFPLAVDAALRRHEVVVVSLVVPGARVDALAAAEAEAGAKLGGAGYLALNVLNEKVAHALQTKLQSLQDPSLLVLKRSGEIALGLEGFVDRETVAQAAANASS
jgi:hypothetical protein